MRRITLKNFAKFNPVLEILGKDAGTGMHFVSTIIASIDHFDLVTVERTGESRRWQAEALRDDALPRELEFVLDRDTEAHLVEHVDRELTALQSASDKLPTDMRNIAARAWRAVCESVEQALPARIRILKRIPVSAGLGGGSGNAACVLVALARLFDLDITSHELAKLAAVLGADVPFFLSGGLMYGGHYGEEVADLGECPEFSALVLKPHSGSDTGDAYREVDGILGLDEGMSRSPRTTRGFITALRQGRDIFPHIRNDFDACVMRKRETGALFGWLQKRHADRVLVAGSGSAVVGVYRNPPSPSLMLAAMNELDDILECGFIARPVPQAIEVVDWE